MMRALLILALLLYNVLASRYYDYEDFQGRRNILKFDRRNWRKSALQGKLDDAKDWDMYRKRDYDPKFDEREGMGRLKEMDGLGGSVYRHEFDPPAPYKSSEAGRYYDNKELDEGKREPPKVTNVEKDKDKMNCEREHERFESCFAGCASITCDNPRDRLRPCYPFCEAGCVCAPPYVRDDRTHKCVLVDECTKGLKGIPDIGEAVHEDTH